jgi:nucleoside 2-deoxyribosyltransferase
MRVFIAYPLAKLISSETGRMEESHIKLIKDMMSCLQGMGHDVFTAHEREKWGEKFNKDDCASLDFAEMKRADLLVAFPETSGGVHVELGWASAMGKPIIIFMERGKYYSPLVCSFERIAKNIKIVFFEKESEIVDKLKNAVENV